MTIRNLLLILPVLATAACTSVYEDDAQGQIVYHWERPRTGVIKFSRDHSECLRAAENWSWTPDINSWFYSEEAKLDIRADWHAERGIWATYVPYPGAQPLIVNSLRDDENIKPQSLSRVYGKSRLCPSVYGHSRNDKPLHLQAATGFAGQTL